MSSARDLGPRLPPRIVVDEHRESGPNEHPYAESVSVKDDNPYECQANSSGSARNFLGELLREHSIPGPDRDNRAEFWPENLLKQLLTPPRVKEAFECSKLRHLAARIDSIMATHFKILAILALMEKLKYIDAFIKNNVCDQDLPLVICTSGSPVALNIARHTAPEQALRFPQSWKTDQRVSFLHWQHCVTPPVLAMGLDKVSAKHENFSPQTVMPWMSTLKKKEEGGFSQVFEVEIHPSCHDFRKVLASLSICGENTFAIKKLTKGKNQDPQDLRLKFESEKRMLERFRGHPHLVTLLMSWTLREEYYFLFPFAESDLDRYWTLHTNWDAVRSPDPDCQYDTIQWISKQIFKMVEALEHIHNLDKTLSVDKRFGRHGDLKPENVLWYRSPEDPKGFLVIADLGLAVCNSEHSRSGIPSHTVARTPNYRSPECDLEDGKISRSYDIWTLGCLLLEMVCWILGGPQARNDFAKERTSTYVTGSQSDIFFDVEENKDGTGHVMFVKRSVEQRIADLHGHKSCPEFLHEMLDVIEQDMLVVLCKEKGKRRDRIASKDLLEKIRSIHTRVQNSRSYSLEPLPKPRAAIRGVSVNANLSAIYLGSAMELKKHNRLGVYAGAPPRAALTAEEY